jgi:hypothetical protein
MSHRLVNVCEMIIIVADGLRKDIYVDDDVSIISAHSICKQFATICTCVSRPTMQHAVFDNNTGLNV